MSIARQTTLTSSTPARKRAGGIDRTTPVYPFGLVEEVVTEPISIDPTGRVLAETLATSRDAAARAQREVWRHEAERRRAAAALEADLRPLRIDEDERARRRAVYVAAEGAVTRAKAELAQATAIADAAQLLADAYAAA